MKEVIGSIMVLVSGLGIYFIFLYWAFRLNFWFGLISLLITTLFIGLSLIDNDSYKGYEDDSDCNYNLFD